MKPTDIDNIIDHYNDLFYKHGFSEKAMGWPKKRNLLRYKILIDDFDLTNEKNILDFGCGLGYFNIYLGKMGIDIQYEGIDINNNLIEAAIEKQPNLNVKCIDALKHGLNKNYNYIVSCGVHNTKISNNFSFIKKTFQLFNTYSKEGFAMNFLSNKVDYMNKNLYYSSPDKIMKLALEFSNSVLLKHDYMPYEFTVIVNKNDKIYSKLNIYEKHKDLTLL